jgi:hypothetical protein
MPLRDMNESCLKNECRDSDGNLQHRRDREVAGHKLILCLPHNDGQVDQSAGHGGEDHRYPSLSGCNFAVECQVGRSGGRAGAADQSAEHTDYLKAGAARSPGDLGIHSGAPVFRIVFRSIACHQHRSRQLGRLGSRNHNLGLVEHVDHALVQPVAHLEAV